jgi:hypothetical protein
MNGGVVFALILFFATANGIVGWYLGRGKGLGRLGFLLGFAFSVVGIVIVAVLEPPEEERHRRLLQEQQLLSKQVAVASAGLVKCPACAELIQPDAKKCKHCGEIIAAAEERRSFQYRSQGNPSDEPQPSVQGNRSDEPKPFIQGQPYNPQ